jgi:Tol biopolymer transport system component
LPILTVCLTLRFEQSTNAQSGKAAQESPIVKLQPVTSLTDDSSWFDMWPAFSPDGKDVVFTRVPIKGERRARLWRMPVSGGAPSAVTPADFDRHCSRPDWSPDGKTIAFRAGSGKSFTQDQPGAIWLLTVATGGIKPLTDDHQHDDYYPHWSPDGKWIYVSRTKVPKGNWDIWRIDLQGNEEQITFHPTYDVYGVPSPDGKFVSFNSDRDGKRNVWIIDLSKGEKEATQFTFGGGRGAWWSPDGQWIAFHPPPSVVNGPIYIRRVTGGPAIQVTQCTGDTFQSHPHWSPDGKHILFDEADPNPAGAATGHLKIVDVSKVVAMKWNYTSF